MPSKDKKDARGRLPEGWTVVNRTIKNGSCAGVSYKCYTSPTGKKLYNAKAMLRYLEAEKTRNRKSKKAGKIKKGRPMLAENTPGSTSRTKSSLTAEKTLGSTSKTKRGLTAEKTPDSTLKSKRSLTAEKTSGSTSKTKRSLTAEKTPGSTLKSKRSLMAEKTPGFTSKTKSSCVKQSQSKVLVERREAVDGLPKGYIQEIVTKKTGDRIRKDPYYIEIKTGYQFRSKPDVMRYVETGDIRSCAIKPKKLDISTVESIDVKSSKLKDVESSNPDEGAEDGKILESCVAAEIRVSVSPSKKNGKLKDVENSNPEEAARDGQMLESCVAAEIPVLVSAWNEESGKLKGVQRSNGNMKTVDSDDELLFRLDRVIPEDEYQEMVQLAKQRGESPPHAYLTHSEGEVAKKGPGRPKKIENVPSATVKIVSDSLAKISKSGSRKRKERK